MFYIGIDLGTSAVKLLLVEESGRIVKQSVKSYPLSSPHSNWSEQLPDNWWDACVAGLRDLLDGLERSQVASIGVAGQMHGLVILDRENRSIRPAILWNDGRSAEEADYLNETIGREFLSIHTANTAFAGFTAPKLLWLRAHEPENFFRIHKIMLPKDYIVFRLTGVHCTDYSDASGTLLLDVKNKCWSPEMLRLCGVSGQQLPKLYESFHVVGTLRPEMARQFGLSASVKIVAGASDNAAAAVGTGAVGEGGCNLSIGTSGTLLLSSNQLKVDGSFALHAFAHADGGYHFLGCMLSAASCNQWFCEKILRTTDYPAEQATIATSRLGRNSVYFLPYLSGERSPINDTDARGLFVGMTHETTRADMVQAVLEGVAFALRDSFETARRNGLAPTRSSLCGGGAKSPLWREILANVLGIPLDTLETEQGASFGAAILAMVGCGVFVSVQEASGALTKVKSTVAPHADLQRRYEQRYQTFQKIYPRVKGLFPCLHQ